MELETLCEGYGLVEGPVWVAGRGLIFSDVVHGGVFCVDAKARVDVVFEHRRGIGGMSLHCAGGLLVSGRNLAYKAFDLSASVTIVDNDPNNACVGFNDITVDSEGRVYAGSLGSSPVFDDGLPPTPGQLFLIDTDGSVEVVAEDVLLTNGLGFSPDGKTLYHSDSRRSTVYSYRVESNGRLGPKLPFATFSAGVPDGLAVAEDGSVWVALADGGGGVAVVDQFGEQQDFIPIPTPMCTSVCFGGADLRDLYIVSGSDGSNSDRAGGVYRTRSAVAGLPVPVARTKLA